MSRKGAHRDDGDPLDALEHRWANTVVAAIVWMSPAAEKAREAHAKRTSRCPDCAMPVTERGLLRHQGGARCRTRQAYQRGLTRCGPDTWRPMIKAGLAVREHDGLFWAPAWAVWYARSLALRGHLGPVIGTAMVDLLADGVSAARERVLAMSALAEL